MNVESSNAEVGDVTHGIQDEAQPPSKRPRLSTGAQPVDPAAVLSMECAAHIAAMATPEQLASTQRLVEMAVATVERIVRQKPQWRNATCEPFGSSVTTLGTLTSDVDMTINLPNFDSDSDPSKRRKLEQKLVKQLARLMQRDASFITTRAVPEARVPIVCSVLAVGGLQCDLSICNELAVLNSKLLRAYIHADPRVRPLALLVRAWGAARGVMSPRKGGLTSYALLLMLLSYLQQQVHPPILPQLQPPPLQSHSYDGAKATQSDNSDVAADVAEDEAKMREVKVEQCQKNQQTPADRHFVQGFDCTFTTSPPKHWQPAPETAHSLGTLLHGFFQFYGHQFGRPTCAENGFKHRIFQVDGHAHGKDEKGREQVDSPSQTDGIHAKDSAKSAVEENDGDDDESMGLLPPIISLRMGRCLERAEKYHWSEPRWLSVEVSNTAKFLLMSRRCLFLAVAINRSCFCIWFHCDCRIRSK